MGVDDAAGGRAARICELSGGGGADVVVDASGVPHTFLPVDSLRDNGTLIEAGVFVDLGPVAFDPAVVCGRNLRLVGVGGGDARAYIRMLALLARHHERVPFARLLTHRSPLTDAADGDAGRIRGGRSSMKVVASRRMHPNLSVIDMSVDIQRKPVSVGRIHWERAFRGEGRYGVRQRESPFSSAQHGSRLRHRLRTCGLVVGRRRQPESYYHHNSWHHEPESKSKS